MTVGNTVYVFGGHKTDTAGESYKWSPGDTAWQALNPAMPRKRVGPACGLVGSSTILVAGGQNPDTLTVLDTADKLNLLDMTWSTGKDRIYVVEQEEMASLHRRRRQWFYAYGDGTHGVGDPPWV